ncbi:MAG: hypothetical protein HQ510_10210 [Candidatus Marinimicrobia bacterium]|nr:hypothetical protein [Candidatus Neomarinimicrobiota bacterium]
MRTYSTKLFIVIVSIAHICFCQDDIYGCTDLLACNYNPEATIDDGSCLYNDCLGECGGTAELDDCGVCCDGITGTECSWYTDADNFGGSYDCSGECFGLAFNNECGCVEGSTGNDSDFCYGCTDPFALNYDPSTTIDDGSCNYEETELILDSDYLNKIRFQYFIQGESSIQNVFSPEYFPIGMPTMVSNGTAFASYIDGFGWFGSISSLIVGVDYLVNGLEADMILFIYPGADLVGCDDPEAFNYNPNVTLNDGSCITEGDVYLYISNATDSAVEISMINTEDVYGFQFTIVSSPELIAEFGGAIGGSADESGFMISTNSNGLVLGFSLTGNSIPSGEGVLTYVNWSFTGSEGLITLEQPSFSSAVGEAMDVVVGDPYEIGSGGYEVFGCTDPEALNYDPFANLDDGSCIYDELIIQLINLTSGGTNWVSFFIIPEINNIQTVFQPLIENSNLISITGSNGGVLYFYNSEWVNSIGGIDPGEVYTVHVNSNTQLQVLGELNPLPVSITLNEGANLVGYPMSTTQSVVSIFQSFIDDNVITTITNNNGDMIVPEYNFEGFEELLSGQGYQVSVNTPIVVHFCEAPTECNPVVYGCINEEAANYDLYATIDDGSCEMCMPGDVNGDEVFDVLDVVAIVSIILNSGPYNSCADINGDGNIDTLDIIPIINFMLGGWEPPGEDQFVEIQSTETSACFQAGVDVEEIQMSLAHSSGFELTITGEADDVILSPSETSTEIIFLAPTGTELFDSNQPFVITDMNVLAYGIYVDTSTYYGSCGAQPELITGCTDLSATNYNPNANIDDGSCLYGDLTTQTFNFLPFTNNLISYYLHPIDQYMIDIFQPLIDSGELANVIDTLGNSIFETENWIVDPFQVYQVTVNSACELSVDGILIQLPVNIYLDEGENSMPYPLSVSTDISEFFSTILDNGSIMIVYDSFGNFFTPEYGIDLIGELFPGQGYQVFMNFSDNLTVNLSGCTDPTSCTYLPQSNIDDGSCSYTDCYGECGGDAVVDECGVCNGFNENVDCSGVCFGIASEDDCGICDDNPENDNECIGCTDPEAYNFESFYFIEDGSCIYLPSENLIYYNQILSGNLNSYLDNYNETGVGIFKSITIENIDGGEAGDEIGLLDYNGQINLGDCDEVSGEVLVGGGIWNNEPLTITSFGAIDLCDEEVQYQQYPGWVENNLLLIHYWKASENQVYIIHCNLSDELDNWSSDNIIIPSINLDEQTLYNINFDCSVDILDIIEVVNYILTDRTIEQYQLEIIDINSDGALDILDIILLVDYILSNQ